MFAKACELRCFRSPGSSGCTATCRFPGVAYLHVEWVARWRCYSRGCYIEKIGTNFGIPAENTPYEAEMDKRQHIGRWFLIPRRMCCEKLGCHSVFMLLRLYHCDVSPGSRTFFVAMSMSKPAKTFDESDVNLTQMEKPIKITSTWKVYFESKSKSKKQKKKGTCFGRAGHNIIFLDFY